MARLVVELSEADILTAVKQYLERAYEMIITGESSLIIEVKSKQNYKSEWERAAYRGRFTNDQ